jgi:hypothetical protein
MLLIQDGKEEQKDFEKDVAPKMLLIQDGKV